MPWSEGCALCGRDDSPDKTLICDRCDREIHMFCLEPKLKKVSTHLPCRNVHVFSSLIHTSRVF